MDCPYNLNPRRSPYTGRIGKARSAVKRQCALVITRQCHRVAATIALSFGVPTCRPATVMSSASSLRAVEIDYRKDQRWGDFVSHHPDALIYHHASWLAALESEYGQRCLCLAVEDPQGDLRAILPLFYTKGMPFKLGRSANNERFASLPRTPMAGPLALDDEAMAAILRQAIELVHTQPGLQLEIKSRQAGLNELVPELSCVPWGFTYVQELPPQLLGSQWEDFCDSVRLPRECGVCSECRRLRFGNAKRQHRVNWAVDKAIRCGLHVREAEKEPDLAAWYPLYLDAMRFHAFPPRPYRFFASLWSTLRPLGQMKLLVAELNTNAENRMVAGSILLRFGQTVFYAFTGCAHQDFHLHPHDLIQLEAIRNSCKHGFRWYDLGEVKEDHDSLAQFKGKWGTEARQLYRYYYPAPADALESKPSVLVSLARRCWRSLPLKLTATLGDQIHRYM